jgi:ureidoglycolate dehydrogenase (NAD+)
MVQVQTPTLIVHHKQLLALTTQVLVAHGLSDTDAQWVAQSLVQANLRGIDSHGVARLPHYIKRLENKSISANPEMRFTPKGTSIGIVDGDHGLGQLVMRKASNHAIDLAREHGIGAVTVCNSSHCGALASYGLHIASENMIGLVMTHSDSMVAPYAATQAFCGTNPICITVPGLEDQHLCLDMATSCVPWNTVMNARIEGVSIPEHWALDANGKTTCDPNEVAALLPMAEFKGSGLGLMIDVLCALLSKSPIGNEIPKMYGEMAKKRLLGGMVIAMDIQQFVPVTWFKNRVSEVQTSWNQSPRQDPHVPVQWPGQPELLMCQQRLTEGIPLGCGTVEALNVLAHACLIEQRLG